METLGQKQYLKKVTHPIHLQVTKKRAFCACEQFIDFLNTNASRFLDS